MASNVLFILINAECEAMLKMKHGGFELFEN